MIEPLGLFVVLTIPLTASCPTILLIAVPSFPTLPSTVAVLGAADGVTVDNDDGEQRKKMHHVEKEVDWPRPS